MGDLDRPFDGLRWGVGTPGRDHQFPDESVADLRDWNFDGSSTGQAPGDDSEVILQAKAIYRDPFRGE